MTEKIRVGTSGWSYDHWVGPFYPPDLPAARRLHHYARAFDSTEIDSSFYGLPSAASLQTCREAVSGDFSFAAKASRYITHMKKLKDADQALATFLARMRRLGDALGPILFQLPPRWRFDAERLERFLAALQLDYRYAFELRDPSWINDQALALLRRHGAAFCIYELDGFLAPKEVTADFVYVRRHGPDGPYRGDYDTRVLAEWAETLASWAGAGLDVYCYLDNDEAGHAVRNALQLRELLAGPRSLPPSSAGRRR